MFVLTLRREPREAFLDAMIKAEGWVNQEVAQNIGPVLRAAALAFFMEGKYPRIKDVSRPEYPLGRTVHGSKPTITTQRFSSEKVANDSVWCIETDFHTWVARDMQSEGDRIFITGNTIYGGGSEDDREQLFNAYPELRTFNARSREDMELLGYARTHYGRKEHLGNFGIMKTKEREHAFRQGGSVMNQGSCSEYVKIGMRKFWEALGSEKYSDPGIKLLLQVHDEVVLEVPHNRVRDIYYLLHETMTYHGLQIPLTIDVSIGPNWAEQAELTLPKLS